MVFSLFVFSLMGPRRKLTQAIAELKGGGAKESDGSIKEGVAPAEKGQEARGHSSPPRGKSRGKLMRQSSTDVAEAYREVNHPFLSFSWVFSLFFTGVCFHLMTFILDSSYNFICVTIHLSLFDLF